MSRYKPPRPKDEILIKESGNWKLSFSQSEKCLYIDTTDYHPFPLKLTRNELKDLLKTLEEMITQES